jgi:hypothetical protein
VKQNVSAPVWNEYWRVRNVPATASLVITVMDKDEGSYTDDCIGTITTTVSAGAKELEIEGPFLKRDRGRLWLKVRVCPPALGFFLFYNTFLDNNITFRSKAHRRKMKTRWNSLTSSMDLFDILVTSRLLWDTSLILTKHGFTPLGRST